ncbi:MAG: hypothetical protein RRB13_04130 [bacterium]|nr:hypothetical protein [bacterium]
MVFGLKGAYHDTENNLEALVTVVNQWVSWGRSLGWIPYIGGGQPFALYNNLIYFPEALIFGKLATLWGLHLSPNQIFQFAYFLAYFSFVTGSGLLFLLFFERRSIAFFGMVGLCWSGMLWTELGQPKMFTAFFGFSWSAFFLLLAIKQRRPWALPFFVLSLSPLVNYYLPTYALVGFGTAFLSAALIYRSQFFAWVNWRPLLVDKKVWITSLAVGLLVFAPVVFSHHVLGDYYSPTRDSLSGTVSVGNTGEQANASAQLRLSAQWVNPAILDLHNTFYLGVVWVLLSPLAMLSKRGRFLLLPAVLLWLLSLGTVTPLWNLLISLPLMNYSRHSFMFGGYSTFFLLLLGLEGLVQLSGNQALWKRVSLLGLGGVFLSVLMCSGEQPEPESVWMAAIFFGILLGFLAGAPVKYRNIAKLALLGGLSVYLILQQMSQIESDSVRASRQVVTRFELPEWFEYAKEVPAGIPFFLRPLQYKNVQWYHHTPGDLFMLQKEFVPLLQKLGPEMQVLINKRAPIFRLFEPAEQPLLESPQALYSLLRQSLLADQGGDWQKGKELLAPHQDFCPQSRLCFAQPERPDPNRKKLKLTLDRPALLLRLVNWSPYWRATLGGREWPIHQGAYHTQWVELPAGEYELEFIYSDPYDALLKLNLLGLFFGWLAKCWWLRKEGGSCCAS